MKRSIELDIIRGIAVVLVLFSLTGSTLIQTPVVAFDGNSLTAGYGVRPWENLPAQVGGQLPEQYAVASFGKNSQTTSAMLLDAAREIDPLLFGGRPGVLVVWEGTNSLYFGASTEEAHRLIVEYCRARKAAGWRVVLLTVLPRSNPGTPGDFEESRTRLNAMLRADFRQSVAYADRLVDVSAIPEIGAVGAELDPRYYLDRVHLTPAGYALIVPLVVSAIEQVSP